jgi:hypothetical protein
MISSMFLFVSLIEGVPSVIKVLCKITGKLRQILINYIYLVYVVSEFAIHIYLVLEATVQALTFCTSSLVTSWHGFDIRRPSATLPLSDAAYASYRNLHSNVVILTSLNTGTTARESSETVGTCLARCEETC